MRKLALPLFCLLLVAAGCHHRINSGVVGSGKRVREKREVASFTSISTQGVLEVQIVAQQPLSLQIEGDDNILPLITTEVSNNVLYLKSMQNYSTGEPISLKIAVPNLEGINISGAGSFDISGLKNDRFEIDASGAPGIKVAGNTKVLDIDTTGAAKIDTHKLHASRAVVDSKGVSKVDLDVTEQLDVTISGPSHVTYQGDPIVNKKINGPGKLDRKGDEGA